MCTRTKSWSNLHNLLKSLVYWHQIQPIEVLTMYAHKYYFEDLTYSYVYLYINMLYYKYAFNYSRKKHQCHFHQNHIRCNNKQKLLTSNAQYNNNWIRKSIYRKHWICKQTALLLKSKFINCLTELLFFKSKYRMNK